MTLNSLFSPLSCQMCLLSSVSLFLFSCLKDIWWFPYLALKLFAVRPMYVSVVFSVVTVAWYTTSSTIHSPFSGQSSFFLQLHTRSDQPATILHFVSLSIVVHAYHCFKTFHFFNGGWAVLSPESERFLFRGCYWVQIVKSSPSHSA